MEIFPAIDLKDRKVVRLTQGDYERMDVYSDDPSEIARQFAGQGARNLHIVDLDGARDGVNVNFDAIRNIVETSGLFVQVGGGLRDERRIRQYIELGVGRVILGTAAVKSFSFLRSMMQAFAEKIAVGVDAREGFVAVGGWVETTRINAAEFCDKLDISGIDAIIYTDIARDGAMQGANLPLYKELAGHLSCKLIAAGGISSMSDIDELRKMGLYGAILGKALYTKKLDLREVMAR
ncbi:MAG: 1-(5-phosphoribosyl)-5-[(5-phosphoribosylamino)methylideneamino]imidazole-4-carboxamide isomerase [Oscillospiraceae bacterium]|nr:1-(5-phosphoribosyl)-5-[(5-phosphoribosylamino)methylideneamino]imidazole-4-carboxamide isomerase [Oscillospiraceae bacterium]